jgi:hypothetical protein
MTTVKKLIEQLQDEHDLDEAIVFQYLVADHTPYSPEVFDALAEAVMDSPDFGSESTQFFLSALEEAEYALDFEVED